MIPDHDVVYRGLLWKKATTLTAGPTVPGFAPTGFPAGIGGFGGGVSLFSLIAYGYCRAQYVGADGRRHTTGKYKNVFECAIDPTCEPSSAALREWSSVLTKLRVPGPWTVSSFGTEEYLPADKIPWQIHLIADEEAYAAVRAAYTTELQQ